MRGRVIAVIAAVGFAAAGCASATTSPSAKPSGSPSSTSKQAAPAPATVTKTVTPSAPPSPAPAATPAPTATSQDPAAVVSAFYAAINAQDYATAWKLGGDNLGSSYGDFAAGFAGTAHDSLTITGVQGNTVDVHLEALQSDGSTKVYDGFYVVGNGQIVEGRLTQSTTVPPTSPGTPPQGVITDPNGGFYARGEFCPTADAGLTTVDASGNVLTCVFESGAWHWH